MADPNFISKISYLKSKNYVIIVAGGSGARMQSAIPKQFLLVKGKPVIMHTVATFENSAAKPQIIVCITCRLHGTLGTALFNSSFYY